MLRLTNEALSIDSESDSVVIEDPSVIGVGMGLIAWANVKAQSVLVTAQVADVLYLVNLGSTRVKEEQLFRDEEPDLRFVTFIPSTSGGLLVLYERGLVFVDSDGAVRWHRLHDDLSAHVVQLSDEDVVLETQWPRELAGSRRRYRLEDGEELPHRNQ
jgi:hypothetical protein